MNRTYLLFSNVIVLLLLAGCWNSKDIQNMAYVTALGLDYKDDKYVAYAQVLNFTNVAKGESVELGKNVPNWIGKGEGKTVTEAFNSLYATSQLRVYWGHVKSIVATETFLEQGDRLLEAYDMMNRYREIRYNILVYATKEPLRDIFSQKSNLNMSPLETLLDTPLQAYSQRFHILPQYGFKVIAQFREPEGSTIVPSIRLEKGSWSEDTTPKTMFQINGAYFFQDQTYMGWMSEEDLNGYRWFQNKPDNAAINIPDDKAPAAGVIIVKPKARIKAAVENGKAVFSIQVRTQAYVSELERDLTKQQIEQQAGQVIAKQIRDTYEKGLRKEIDVLNLGTAFYRDYPQQWKQLWERKGFMLTEDSLRAIDVKVSLKHTGKYRLRVE